MHKYNSNWLKKIILVPDANSIHETIAKSKSLPQIS